MLVNTKHKQQTSWHIKGSVHLPWLTFNFAFLSSTSYQLPLSNARNLPPYPFTVLTSSVETIVFSSRAACWYRSTYFLTCSRNFVLWALILPPLPKRTSTSVGVIGASVLFALEVHRVERCFVAVTAGLLLRCTTFVFLDSIGFFCTCTSFPALPAEVLRRDCSNDICSLIRFDLALTSEWRVFAAVDGGAISSQTFSYLREGWKWFLVLIPDLPSFIRRPPLPYPLEGYWAVAVTRGASLRVGSPDVYMESMWLYPISKLSSMWEVDSILIRLTTSSVSARDEVDVVVSSSCWRLRSLLERHTSGEQTMEGWNGTRWYCPDWWWWYFDGAAHNWFTLLDESGEVKAVPHWRRLMGEMDINVEDMVYMLWRSASATSDRLLIVSGEYVWASQEQRSEASCRWKQSVQETNCTETRCDKKQRDGYLSPSRTELLVFHQSCILLHPA